MSYLKFETGSKSRFFKNVTKFHPKKKSGQSPNVRSQRYIQVITESKGKRNTMGLVLNDKSIVLIIVRSAYVHMISDVSELTFGLLSRKTVGWLVSWLVS